MQFDVQSRIQACRRQHQQRSVAAPHCVVVQSNDRSPSLYPFHVLVPHSYSHCSSNTNNSTDYRTQYIKQYKNNDKSAN